MIFLYISSLASNSIVERAFHANPHSFGYAAQKFNRLVVTGLSRNGHDVTALSTFPHIDAEKENFPRTEMEGDIKYKYISGYFDGAFRHMIILAISFYNVLLFGLKARKKKAVICDALNISSCAGAIIAARIVGLRCVGIVTDIPGLLVESDQKMSYEKSFACKINSYLLNHFTHYVLLTQEMNKIVNPKNRPNIVMEGLVDIDSQQIVLKRKETKRIVLYAGGLYERYGLKTLAEAFMNLDDTDLELWLYGKGSFVEELVDYSAKDNRIIYKGMCPNSEIVEAESAATLLVNPRPTNEDFSKFSFPSKNMEYMASGTPLLTTILPGMPADYYPYVFLFDRGETVEGYTSTLRHILSLPLEVLDLKGKEARQWILKNKNNLYQTNRIVQLVEK